MRVELNGKIALVTGAARNIGKAIADNLATNGAIVVYADIDAAGVAEAARAFPNCLGVTLDVTNDQQARDVLSEVEKRFGRLDILVNNAGTNSTHRVNIDEYPRSEWDRLIAIDLTGLFTVSQAGAGIMRRHGGGKIINIASAFGLVPARLQCAFVAAKAGVVNLTKAMALELAPYGILTNCVAPGSILTDGTKRLFYAKDGMFSAFAEQMLAHIPLGRPGTPEEVAHAVLFLAAPESSYVNGHILTVDGGWTAGYLRDF